MKCTECSREINPVVAFDIDGTMAEYHDHLREMGEIYFNRTLPVGWDGEGDWEEYLGLTRDEYRDLKLAFRQGGYKRSMPVIDRMDTIPGVAKELGAEVWITTTRPWNRHDSVDPDTKEWLRRNGVMYDHLLYDEHKYSRLLSIVGQGRVVAVVDDLPEQYGWAAVAFGKEIPVLVARPHNMLFRERMGNSVTIARTTNDVQNAVELRIKEWYVNGRDSS